MWLRSAAAAAAMLSAMAPGAAARAQTASGDRVLGAFAECRTIPAADARLACFDRAAASLEAAVKARDVTIVDRQDVKKARRSLFGFALPRIDLFGGGRRDDEKEEAFTEINASVASARAGGDGRVEIRLADEGDAVWQVIDPMPFPPKAGARIRIRQGALGNYFLMAEGRSYRGRRLR